MVVPIIFATFLVMEILILFTMAKVISREFVSPSSICCCYSSTWTECSLSLEHFSVLFSLESMEGSEGSSTFHLTEHSPNVVFLFPLNSFTSYCNSTCFFVFSSFNFYSQPTSLKYSQSVFCFLFFSSPLID
jgi:hypothetical protein